MHFCVISNSRFHQKSTKCVENEERTQPQSREFKFQIKVKHLIYYTFFCVLLLQETSNEAKKSERLFELNKRNY
jgi:hypothetical protein